MPCFELAEDDFVDLARCQPPVAQRGGAEILGAEGSAVEQVPAPLPMRLGLIGRRLFGDQHEILDQRPADALRHADQQVDVVGADDDHRGREQLVGVGHRLAQLAPVVAVDLRQIGFAADRRALVPADRVGGGDAVGEECGDGRARAAAGHDSFPGKRRRTASSWQRRRGSGACKDRARQARRHRGRAPAPSASLKSAASSFAHQISPPASTQGNSREAVTGLVEIGEAIGARHAGQLAVGLVGPGVIGADDPLGGRRLVRCRSAGCRDGGRHWRRHGPCRHRRGSGSAACHSRHGPPPAVSRGSSADGASRCGTWSKIARCSASIAVGIDIDAGRQCLDALAERGLAPRKGIGKARWPGVGRRGVRGMSMTFEGCASWRSVARANRPNFRHAPSPLLHFPSATTLLGSAANSSRGEKA